MDQGKHWTDQEILEGIKSGKKNNRDTALAALFNMPQLKEKAIAMAIKYGENPSYAADIYLDAFILAERKLRQGGFRFECSISTWVISIVKWLCISKRQKENRRLALPQLEPIDIEVHPELEVLTLERKEALKKALDQLGHFCKELLKYYAEGFRMQEIEELMKLANIKKSEKKKENESKGDKAKGDDAKENVRQCKGKLRKIIENNPLLTDLLKP